MIKVNVRRDKGGGEVYTFEEKIVSTTKAFNQIVRCEFLFGGKVTEITETKIVVKTNVMGCLDTTSFEGSAHDMEPIVKMAATVEHCGRHLVMQDSVISKLSKSYVTMPGEKDFLIKHVKNTFVGMGRVKAAILVLLSDDAMSTDQLKDIDSETLIELTSLKLVDKCSTEELLSLIA
jgi:hypothetical protein